MSVGVPGREGARVRQRYSSKIRKKKHRNSVIASRRRSNPYACRLLRRKIAPRNDKLTASVGFKNAASFYIDSICPQRAVRSMPVPGSR